MSSVTPTAVRKCSTCGSRVSQPATGRPRLYCNGACRQKAHRARQAPDVLAAQRWRSNGHLIAALARLGHLRADWRTLDPTYGRGVWWRIWRPRDLTAHDLAYDGVDFRDLPHGDGAFDAAVFDPPYVHAFGATSAFGDKASAYGLVDGPKGRAELEALASDGLAEVHRVVRRGGNLLVKTKDEVESGRLRLGAHHVLTAAERLGCRVVERFVYLAGPTTSRYEHQIHARRNYSELLVLRRTS